MHQETGMPTHVQRTYPDPFWGHLKRLPLHVWVIHTDCRGSQYHTKVLDPGREMKCRSTLENVESAKHAMHHWFCNEIVDFLVLTWLLVAAAGSCYYEYLNFVRCLIPASVPTSLSRLVFLPMPRRGHWSKYRGQSLRMWSLIWNVHPHLHVGSSDLMNLL